MVDETSGGGAASAMSSDPGLEEIGELIRNYVDSSEHRYDAHHVMARLMIECIPEPDAWLDVAASVAAQHSAFEGCEDRLRSLLALLAFQEELSRQVGGKPRKVIDDAAHLAMIQAKLRGEAMAAIWRVPMLEPKDAAVALGAKATNRERVRQQRERSWLLGLPRDRGYLYPAFQFDRLRREVFPEVRAVNELLDAASHPWGVASWWISKNAYIDAAPMEFVDTDRSEDLVAVAAGLLEPIG